MNRELPNICLFILIAAGVLAFALLPGLPFDLSTGGSIQHLFAFSFLAALSLLMWPNALPQLIWVSLVAFGGVIELLQGWMALGRQPQWSDWLVDVIAVSLTMAIFGVARILKSFRLAQFA